MGAHAFNSKTQEAEAVGSPWVQGQLGLQNKSEYTQQYTEKPYLEKPTKQTKANQKHSSNRLISLVNFHFLPLFWLCSYGVDYLILNRKIWHRAIKYTRKKLNPPPSHSEHYVSRLQHSPGHLVAFVEPIFHSQLLTKYSSPLWS